MYMLLELRLDYARGIAWYGVYAGHARAPSKVSVTGILYRH
jgi:hypothetical protein